MLVNVPDHYISNVAGAMVERAVGVINLHGYVPAHLHQFAALWDQGLRYADVSFWQAVFDSGAMRAALSGAGLIDHETGRAKQ